MISPDLVPDEIQRFLALVTPWASPLPFSITGRMLCARHSGETLGLPREI